MYEAIMTLAFMAGMCNVYLSKDWHGALGWTLITTVFGAECYKVLF